MPMARETDAARAMNGLRRIVRALRTGNSQIERATGVTAAQLFALRQIARRPGSSLTELAAATQTNQSSISEVVGRLVERGLVTRTVSNEDHRRTHLHPTPSGRTALAKAPETPQEKLLAGFVALSPQKQRQLAAGLDKWLAEAGLEQVQPTMFFEESFIKSPQAPRRRGGTRRTLAGVGSIEGSPQIIDERERADRKE